MIKNFKVTGMDCASCALVIARTIKKIDGANDATVNYGNETATVDYDPSKITTELINEKIKPLGYEIIENKEIRDGAKLEQLKKLQKRIYISIPLVVISFFAMFATMMEISLGYFHYLMPVFATIMLFFVGTPYLLGIWKFIRYRVANMDTLVGIGTLVAFIYSFFLPIDSSYFDVTTVVIGLVTLGKYLEARSKIKTGEAIEKLVNLQVKKAILLINGKEELVDIKRVKEGDILVVKPGQQIPLDGIILKGFSSIDESMITGESIPVDKSEGDNVIGATINRQGHLEIKVTKIGNDTVLAKIIAMVESAQGSKAPIERMADLVSSYFVPIILVIALITLVIWLILGNISLAVICFVSVLVIACPCAMGLATPTAIIVGVGKAAMNGILIKNAESLEKLASVNTIVFDKTGTITQGTPVVTDVISTQKNSQEKILQILGSLEKKSEHPLALSVVSKMEEEKIEGVTVKNFEAIFGKGIKGTINKVEYFAGNLKYAKELNIKVDTELLNEFHNQGKSIVILFTKKEVIGYVAISDVIKTGAMELIKRLSKFGIKTVMLSGDNKLTATYIAQKVGINEVISEVAPSDKGNEIKKLQEAGKTVAMVGDGVNDAVALTIADVGIAMSTGSDIAIESSGVTILNGNIEKVGQVVTLSRNTMRTIKQNLFWAFFYNIIGIPIAAGVLYPAFGMLLSPMIAGGAMALSSIFVVTNSLLLKRTKII